MIMQVVIRMDVIKSWAREFGKKAAAVIDWLFAFGIAGAGVVSFVYLCHCIFMWLAVA